MLPAKHFDSFRQSLTQEQFKDMETAINDDADPPVLLSAHEITFQRFVNAAAAYAGPVPLPVGLVLPAVMTQETLKLAILDSFVVQEPRTQAQHR